MGTLFLGMTANEVILIIACVCILATFVTAEAALGYQMGALESAAIGAVLMLAVYFMSKNFIATMAGIVAAEFLWWKAEPVPKLAKSATILTAMMWLVLILRLATHQAGFGLGLDPAFIVQDALLLIAGVIQSTLLLPGKGAVRKLKLRLPRFERGKKEKREKRDTAQEAVASAVPPERNGEDQRVSPTWKIAGVTALIIIVMLLVWGVLKIQLYLPAA